MAAHMSGGPNPHSALLFLNIKLFGNVQKMCLKYFGEVKKHEFAKISYVKSSALLLKNMCKKSPKTNYCNAQHNAHEKKKSSGAKLCKADC